MNLLGLDYFFFFLLSIGQEGVMTMTVICFTMSSKSSKHSSHGTHGAFNSFMQHALLKSICAMIELMIIATPHTT